MYAEVEEQLPSKDGSQTAFRAAEKRFQMHKDQIFKTRKGRRISKGYVVRPTDFSGVLDLQSGGLLPEGVACLGVPSGMPPSAAAFTFAVHPGLLLVRGALEPAQQRQLMVDALTHFCEPPNHTNHTRAYPAGLPGIWVAAQQGLRLQVAQPDAAQALPAAAGVAAAEAHAAEVEGPLDVAAGSATAGTAEAPEASTAAANCSSPAGTHSRAAGCTPVWGAGGSGPLAEALLQKLRWATLGPPYDWTQRRYLRNVPHVPLPPELCELAVSLASLAASLAGGGGAAATAAAAAAAAEGAAAAGRDSSDATQGQSHANEAAKGEQGDSRGCAAFRPDAAIVNYYSEGDTLNGHIDDAEPHLDKPLVSLSLGCDAVFLMGSTTKDVAPTPLLLRSGDAVVLSGQARRCYHGVPRVLTGDERPQAEALPARGSSDGSGVGKNGSSGSGSHGSSGGDDAEGDGEIEASVAGEDDAFAPFARHMRRCRINISIRDTR